MVNGKDVQEAEFETRNVSVEKWSDTDKNTCEAVNRRAQLVCFVVVFTGRMARNSSACMPLKSSMRSYLDFTNCTCWATRISNLGLEF
jgi:hypothetical protein